MTTAPDVPSYNDDLTSRQDAESRKADAAIIALLQAGDSRRRDTA